MLRNISIIECLIECLHLTPDRSSMPVTVSFVSFRFVASILLIYLFIYLFIYLCWWLAFHLHELIITLKYLMKSSNKDTNNCSLLRVKDRNWTIEIFISQIRSLNSSDLNPSSYVTTGLLSIHSFSCCYISQPFNSDNLNRLKIKPFESDMSYQLNKSNSILKVNLSQPRLFFPVEAFKPENWFTRIIIYQCCSTRKNKNSKMYIFKYHRCTNKHSNWVDIRKYKSTYQHDSEISSHSRSKYSKINIQSRVNIKSTKQINIKLARANSSNEYQIFPRPHSTHYRTSTGQSYLPIKSKPAVLEPAI